MKYVLISVCIACVSVIVSCVYNPTVADGGVHPDLGTYYEFTNYHTGIDGVRSGPKFDTIYILIHSMSVFNKSPVFGFFSGRRYSTDTFFVHYEASGDFAFTTPALNHVWQILPFASRSTINVTELDTVYSDGSSLQIRKTSAHVGIDTLTLPNGEVLECQKVRNTRVSTWLSASGSVTHKTILVEEYWYKRSVAYFTKLLSTQTDTDSLGNNTTFYSERTLTKYYLDIP